MQKDMKCNVQIHNAIQTNQRTEFVLYVIQWNYKIVFVSHISIGESVEKTKFVLQNYRQHKKLFWKGFCQEQNVFLKLKHSAHSSQKPPYKRQTHRYQK